MAQAPVTGRRRDSQATKELLLAAATEEFSEHGFAGARIDRIAERAGANKRLLYVYFGDKDALFDAVLARHVHNLLDAAPFTVDDLGKYAGAAFDYLLANPQTARLVAWRGFERSTPGEMELRSSKVKLEAIRKAQRAGLLDDSMSAVDLYAIVLRMVASWLQAPPAVLALAGKNPMSATRLRQHRGALVEAVRRVTAPR